MRRTSSGEWLIILVHTITPTDQVWYNPVAITDVTGAMSHGQSLPDVWNDSVVHIAAYWRAQKMFAALTPAIAGGASTWTWTLPASFPPGQFLRVTATGGNADARGSTTLAWDAHGFYEVSLDAGTLTLSSYRPRRAGLASLAGAEQPSSPKHQESRRGRRGRGPRRRHVIC